MTHRFGMRRRVLRRARVASQALRFRSEEGGSLVEFAITAPLLFVVLAMAATFTLAFFDLQQLGNATAAAVQAIAAEQGVTGDPCNLAMTTIQSELPGFTAANLSYTLVVTGTTGTSTSFASGSYGGSTGFSCGSGDTTSTNFAAGEPVKLTVSYTYSWFGIPTLPFFGKMKATGPLTATETAMAD
jgi:Flp pilus assembly protein TadG